MGRSLVSLSGNHLLGQQNKLFYCNICFNIYDIPSSSPNNIKEFEDGKGDGEPCPSALTWGFLNSVILTFRKRRRTCLQTMAIGRLQKVAYPIYTIYTL